MMRAALVAIAAASLASTSMAQELSGSWKVEKAKSKLDDSPSVFLHVLSKEQHPTLFPGKAYIRIWLRCVEGITAAFFSFEGHIVNDINGGNVVDYRVDARKAKKAALSVSTNREALGYFQSASARKFIEDLYDAKTLVMRTKPYDEGPLEAEFDIEGLREAAAPLRAACNWSPATAPKNPAL